MFADDHAFVDRIARNDEEPAPGLEVVEAVGDGLAASVGNEETGGPVVEVATVGLVPRKVGVHDAGPLRVGEEDVAVADEGAGRNGKIEPDSASLVADVGEHPALARRHLVGDDARVDLAAIDRQVLDRFELLPVLEPEDDLGPADADLEVLAPEHLDQDDELEFPPAPHDEPALDLRLLDLDRHVAKGFLSQALEELHGLDVLALEAGEGRGIDRKEHGDGRLVDDDPRQGLRGFARADGIPDVNVFYPRKDDDVAGFGAFGLDQLDPRIGVELGDVQDLADLAFADADKAVLEMGMAVHHLADGLPSKVIRVGKVGDEHLEGLALGVLGRRDMTDDRVEKRGEVVARPFEGLAGHALLADRVEQGKLELLVVRAQIDEQVVDFAQDLGWPRVRTVDLVDHDDDRKPALEGLVQHEPGLGQGAFGGVDEEDGSVHHGKRPLDLPSEVGMARGIQDVDLGSLPDDRAVLRRDGDSALPFEVHAVHEAFGGFLALAEEPGLPEHGVDEGGFAVIDMGDDGNISDGGIGCVFMRQFFLI